MTTSFATLTNIQFFVENRREQVQSLVDQISPTNVSQDVVQEAGEDLGTILGQAIEVRATVKSIKCNLE